MMPRIGLKTLPCSRWMLVIASSVLLLACATTDAPFGATAHPATTMEATTMPAPPPVATMPSTVAGKVGDQGENWRNSYRLGTGDRVRIEVYREPDLTVEAVLDAAGTINFPLLGVVPAKGLTVQELEQLITTRLNGDYLKNPSVRAVISQFRPVYVIGAVRSSGSFAYSEGLTVERALALAGGPTPQASTRRIYVLPEGGATASRTRVLLDTPLRPGETVLVEEGVF